MAPQPVAEQPADVVHVHVGETASVTDAGSMPAAFSRRANCPARGKSGNAMPSPRR